MKHSVMGHGSPMATHKVHGGKHAGAGELMVGSGPGSTTKGIKTMMAGSQFEGGAKTSGKAPKGMSTYREE